MVDLNPLHYVSKFNHMFGDSIASGLEFLGISDPAVDPDGIREIAKKWRALAKGLEDASSAAERAVSGVEWEGKAAKAFSKRSKAARKSADDMAHSLREGAKALDDFADKAHEMLSEIGVMLAEIAEFEIAGLALSILTAGASEVASTLMAGERALKVVALVVRIEEEGTALGSVVRGVMEVIRGVERALKALKEIRGVAEVAKMAKGGLEFTAFQTLLEDPGAFKDPKKLAGILAEGAVMGVGLGMLGKLLGKGVKALKPSELAELSKAFKLNCAAFERLKLNPAFDKLPASVRNMVKRFVRDPIDVATGDMALTRTDVTLPGVLPLILQRTHLSSYRWGGWFGPSWASTLDQRIQADDEGFVYATPDGARLCFPRPHPGTNEPVRPDTPGSRLTLSWNTETDGAVQVHDPDTGLTHVFHSPVAAADDTAVDLPLQYLHDRNGNRVTVEYEDGDIPAAVVHSGGYRIALDHDRARTRITGLRLTDPARPDRPGTRLLTFGYDAHGHLTEETDSSGLPMRYTYDADGRITSWTDRNDTTYWYAYDTRGRVTATGGTGGALASTLAYDDTTRTTHVTDSLGHTRTYQHNENLRLIRETDPLGHVVVQEWDERLQLTARTDALGRTTRCTRDEKGHILSLEQPDGSRTLFVYNELGLATSITRPDGSTTLLEFDGAGNRTSITNPAGAVTRFVHNGRGHLTAVVNALGARTGIRCDAAGLPVETIDPLGAVTRCERDAFGRQSTVTDPLGATTRLEWNTAGKLTRRVHADGSFETWEYDAQGNCLTSTDPNGAVSRFEYVQFGLQSARTGPDGARCEFEHDEELRLRKVINPQGLTWSYDFDPAGRLISESDFDGRVVRYSYDAAGQLATRTTPSGAVVHHERDAAGRTVVRTADGSVTTYAYDATGGMTRATSADAVVTLERDTAGRLVAETVNGRTQRYGYDALGQRVSRTTPTGAVSTWSYDAVGRRSGLHSAGRTMAFERDAAGQELTRRIGDSLILARTFDPLGRLTRQELTGPHQERVQSRAYTYRADGSLRAVEDHLTGSVRFDLDDLGRVTGVHANDWTERYAYDAAGNLTQAFWPSSMPEREAVGPRTYTATRVRSAGGLRYEYDAAGRVTLRQKIRLSARPDTWRYTWDPEDRLVCAVTPDGTRWRYLHDALGRRIAKQRLAADGGEGVVEQVDFTWDGATLCEQSTWSAGDDNAVTLTWDHDGTAPLTQQERVHRANLPQHEVDARFFAVITDLVGTPTELVDEHGSVAWRARATLWGTTTWNRDATAHTPLRFPGQYHDPETGLHYNYFRHYDPAVARYVTPDPLGLAPSPNPVAYVPNPLRGIDPLGLAEPTPQGDRGNPFPDRASAERAAFDLAGVNHGAEPDFQWEIGDDVTRRGQELYVYDTEPSHWGHMRQFETPHGSRVVVEHTDDPAGSHFHVGQPKGADPGRTGVNFGWASKTPFDVDYERYGKVNKAVGDHHLFYEGGKVCP